MKAKIFFGIIYAAVPFWQNFFSRNNDSPIVNEGTIENPVEMYVI